MKTLTKLSIAISLACLLFSAALAQKKVVRKAPNSSTTICKVESVPKGMVIVGYQKNAACTAGLELLVKRPAASETVCADSPVPESYTVVGMRGSIPCTNGDSNPLTNALLITDGDASSTPARESVFNDYSPPPVRRGNSAQSQVEKRAAQLNAEARLENASDRQEVTPGMTMAQVQKAWGSPTSKRKSTRSGSGKKTTWTYEREGQEVDVYFDNSDIVTSYELVEH